MVRRNLDDDRLLGPNDLVMRPIVPAVLSVLQLAACVELAGCASGSSELGASLHSSPPSGPAPGATPSPSGSGAAAGSGRVLDAASGLPLAGASIALGPLDSHVVPAVVATSAADGTFAFSGAAAGAQLLEVALAPGGYATLHAAVVLAAGSNALGTRALTLPGSAQRAWLAQIEIDRATYGAGPVAFDEYALEAAQAHVAEEAALGYYAHTGRDGSSPQSRYAALGGLGEDAENLDLAGPDSTWMTMEEDVLSEGPPPSGETNHFSILVDPREVWAGLGIASGTAPPQYPGFTAYYAQEFVRYP